MSMKKMIFTLVDMDCAACAITIDDALEKQKGIAKAMTNYAQGKVHVEFDPTIVSESEIIEEIKKSGYTAKYLKA